MWPAAVSLNLVPFVDRVHENVTKAVRNLAVSVVIGEGVDDPHGLLRLVAVDGGTDVVGV
jgi:hypothetical protein